MNPRLCKQSEPTLDNSPFMSCAENASAFVNKFHNTIFCPDHISDRALQLIVLQIFSPMNHETKQNYVFQNCHVGCVILKLRTSNLCLVLKINFILLLVDFFNGFSFGIFSCIEMTIDITMYVINDY